ncbi:MAG: DUF559 domain-containing protein [Candidatus Peribacteraceae bacterium]|nr:DUF559 domain-containing protein [Candidatus Peribacteraceae bacterium]
MFTGIIEATAEIVKKTSTGLVLARPASFDDIKRGSSVCVSGACLTVTELTKKTMAFDVVPETWKRTKLGTLQKGDRVNLERAMPASGRFDGHIVQGHVEGVGEVLTSIPRPLSPEFPPSPYPFPEIFPIPRPLPPRGEGECMPKAPVRESVLSHAREMRREPTKAEEVLWQSLRYDNLGFRFRRQHPMGMYILDFYCHDAKLAIEVDGSIHREPEKRQYDRDRTEGLLEMHNITILRFSNEDVLHHMPFVLQEIRKHLPSSPPPSGEGAPSASEGRVGEEEERWSGVEGGKESSLTIRSPNVLLPFIIPKGSIVLDGVSLTVMNVAKDCFSVALIPTTLQETTLGLLREGDSVNIETDILGRYVRHFLPSR